MAARILILVVLAAICLGTGSPADDGAGAQLPSRKASVVLPLLDKLDVKNSPDDVVSQLKKLLGNPDFGVGDGAMTRLRDTDYYWLEDKTEILADYINQKLTRVSVLLPGQTAWKILYTHPEAPRPRPD